MDKTCDILLLCAGMTFSIVCAIFLLSTTIENSKKYQRKAVENGLATTVVNMYKEEHQSVKDIAFWLGIKAESIYDILDAEEK